MPFPIEYPKDSIAALLNAQKTDLPHLVLAGYEVLGFGLAQYFGDVKFNAGLDFGSLSKIAEGADLVTKIQTRAVALKGAGFGPIMVILKLLSEFGPIILQLVQSIRDLLNKPQV